jgi:sugar-specific transcriptional regulator TrmB
MLKTLLDFGFKQQEAEVYIFLALNGPKKAKDIVNSLKTGKRQVYRILKKLQSKEIVNATLSAPVKFSAVSIEKVLDLFMESAIEQAKVLQASRKELLSTWRNLSEKDSSNS